MHEFVFEHVYARAMSLSLKIDTALVVAAKFVREPPLECCFLVHFVARFVETVQFFVVHV